MNAKKYVVLTLLVLLCCFSLASCSSPPAATQENYDKISVGMKYDEVIALMGEPDVKQSPMNIAVCQWQDSKTVFVVIFQDQAVNSKKSQPL